MCLSAKFDMSDMLEQHKKPRYHDPKIAKKDSWSGAPQLYSKSKELIVCEKIVAKNMLSQPRYILVTLVVALECLEYDGFGSRKTPKTSEL